MAQDGRTRGVGGKTESMGKGMRRLFRLFQVGGGLASDIVGRTWVVDSFKSLDDSRDVIGEGVPVC